MVSLYSADISDIAVPVKKEKKIRSKKNVPQTPPPSENNDTPDGSSNEQVPVPSKPKKQATEKQLAALAKAQETRKRKREEKLAEEAKQLQDQKDQEAKVVKEEEEKQAKKEAAKEKRRLLREAKKATPSLAGTETTTDIIEKAVEEVTKTKRRKIDSPPSWFKNYVNSVKMEEATQEPVPRPKKEIKKEAHAQAESKWQDGFVRDNVQNETDRHMAKMYSMIFGTRQMH